MSYAILTIFFNHISNLSRKRKADHFYSLYKNALLPSSNYFLKTFRFSPKYYTGLSIEDLSQMNKYYPGKRFVEYPGGRFPFNNKEFDWVFSNAVIEHVGDVHEQPCVLKWNDQSWKFFFTTPNKCFPIESHTNVIFLHWNDAMFYRWCKKNNNWVSRNTLFLFSYFGLKTLLDSSQASKYSIYKNRFCGLVMTFTVVCSGG